MSDVGLSFTADPKAAQRALDAMTRQVAGLKEEIRSLGKESKRSTDSWASGLANLRTQNDKFAAGLANIKKQNEAFKAAQVPVRTLRDEIGSAGKTLTRVTTGAGTSLASMAAGVFTVTAAVGFAKEAYSQWRETMVDAEAAHKRFVDNLVFDLARAGKGAEGAKIEAFLGSVPGATADQVRAAFSGVAQSAPLMGTERQLAVAGQVARQAPTGRDMEQFGRIAGAVADLKPGGKADDVADIAAKLEAVAGGGAEKIGGDKFLRSIKSLVAAGQSPEQALGLGLAAMDANVNPETITQVAAAIGGPNEQIKTSRTKKRLTEDEKLKNKFSAASATERASMLQNDPAISRAVLGDDAAFQFQRISKDAIAARAADLTGAQTGNFAQRQLEQLQGFGAGREKLSEQAIDVGKQNIDKAAGLEESQRNQFIKLRRAHAQTKGGLYPAVAELDIGAQRAMEFVGMGGMARGLTREADLSKGVQAGVLTQEQADTMRRNDDLIQEQIKALRENTEATKESTKQANGGGGMVRAGLKNVDAHIE